MAYGRQQQINRRAFPASGLAAVIYVSDNCLGTQHSAVWPRRRVVLQRQTQIVCRYSTPPACTAQAATRHLALHDESERERGRSSDGGRALVERRLGAVLLLLLMVDVVVVHRCVVHLAADHHHVAVLVLPRAGGRRRARRRVGQVDRRTLGRRRGAAGRQRRRRDGLHVVREPELISPAASLSLSLCLAVSAVEWPSLLSSTSKHTHK